MYDFIILHSLEAATLLWMIVATEALIYSIQEFRDVWRGWLYNREYGNGRRAISRRRVKMAVGFMVGFFIAELAGVLAGGILVAGSFGLVELPAPDYRVSTALVRLFLVAMIFAFRSAMKNQRAVRKDLEILAEIERERAEKMEEAERIAKAEGLAKAEHIEGLVEDTHEKVSDIHGKMGDENG